MPVAHGVDRSDPAARPQGQGRGIIAAAQLSAYERWELPTVEGSDADAAGPLTAAQLEALQQAAYDEGFARGRAQGVEQGLAQTSERMAPALAALNEAAAVLVQPFAELDAEIEAALVELAMTVARSLVHREPSADPGVVVDAVRAGVAALAQDPRVLTVELNPQDLRLVHEALGDRVQQHGWRLEANAAVSRGGCVIRSESSRVDATVESRLAEVISHVLGGVGDELDAQRP